MKRHSNLSQLLLSLTIVVLATSASLADDLHLFILSGQSNMAGLRPEASFIPTVEKEFGAANTIVVKDAVGGQPIRRWFKQWKPESGDKPAATGDLYDRLMKKVDTAVGDKKPKTVTFVWMQGERDAKEKHGNVYGASLRGLIDQLQTDLGRKDVNFVIGRLSDFDNDNKRYPHWTIVREAQVKIAEDDKRGSWVDTDELNGDKDDLHYVKEGYVELGRRFADESIKLIKAAK
jgi:hypothetical protein